jgi:hypothetical protein
MAQESNLLNGNERAALVEATMMDARLRLHSRSISQTKVSTARHKVAIAANQLRNARTREQAELCYDNLARTLATAWGVVDEGLHGKRKTTPFNVGKRQHK